MFERQKMKAVFYCHGSDADIASHHTRVLCVLCEEPMSQPKRNLIAGQIALLIEDALRQMKLRIDGHTEDADRPFKDMVKKGEITKAWSANPTTLLRKLRELDVIEGFTEADDQAFRRLFKFWDITKSPQEGDLDNDDDIEPESQTESDVRTALDLYRRLFITLSNKYPRSKHSSAPFPVFEMPKLL